GAWTARARARAAFRSPRRRREPSESARDSCRASRRPLEQANLALRETEMKLSQLKSQWSVMSYYQRFESAVAVALTFVIGFIIVVALYRLASTVVVGMVSGILDPLDQKVFQNVFGEIMTLLIALEFNH